MRTQRPRRPGRRALPCVLALLAGLGLAPESVAGPAGPATAIAASPGATMPSGIWIMQNGKAAVELMPCAGAGRSLCGRLVWGRADQWPQGQRRDINNMDPALRGRDLCHAPIIWGLEPEGDGEWGGGRVYDPHSGRVYRARLTAQGPDRLTVRGYIAIPWIGKSQTWTPAPAGLELCRPLPDS
ncbi:DUF2147 domain-containing protein [Oleisolibacter albus]|uniref:DUF2147 domain-containing protein n=1 Tax=Oleisolibacter albus TaxID=2171757 RepID=UPI000DF42CBE|nr:DUF2147 domain-containing protein [Oleisolibacter albus]